MNTDLELKTGNWLLVVGSHTTVPTILRMIGRLAESGPVRVVDGGFLFNTFIVKSGTRGGMRVLDRIQVYKAYSCREMLTALESLASAPEPFVILDFLTTFFYFFEDFAQRKSLLRLCLAQLNRLEQGSSGLVSVHLPKVLSQAESELLEIVTRARDEAYHVEMALAAPLPVRVH